MISFEEPTLEVSKDDDRETNSLGVGVSKGGEKQDGATGEEAGQSLTKVCSVRFKSVRERGLTCLGKGRKDGEIHTNVL